MPYMMVCCCCPTHFPLTPEEYRDRDRLRLCPKCQAVHAAGRDPARSDESRNAYEQYMVTEAPGAGLR